MYLPCYVHCYRNICHQCGNVFANSSDFNCHFFQRSNMWSPLYHVTLQKGTMCNYVAALIQQWPLLKNEKTNFKQLCLLIHPSNRSINPIHLDKPYNDIVIGVVAQSFQVICEILSRENNRRNPFGLSTWDYYYDYYNCQDSEFCILQLFFHITALSCYALNIIYIFIWSRWKRT